MRKLRRGLLELAIAEAKTPCPLKGKMSARGSFVQSHNNTNRTKNQDTYIGMMGNHFKTRCNLPNSSFRIATNEHLWKPKEASIGYMIRWTILDKTTPRSPA